MKRRYLDDYDDEEETEFLATCYFRRKKEIPYKYISSFNIPSGSSEIASNTFLGCNSLTSITIPNSVTSIGKYAFSDCFSLTYITIPNTHTHSVCSHIIRLRLIIFHTPNFF